MPARMLQTHELQQCVEAIATRHPDRPRLSPGASDYDVLDTDRYCRVFIRNQANERITAGTEYVTYVVSLTPAKATVVGQFLSRRRADGEDETVVP
jgi:hypothetical protein